jgi:hypothetical protein
MAMRCWPSWSATIFAAAFRRCTSRASIRLSGANLARWCAAPYNRGMLGKRIVACLLLVVVAFLVAAWIANFFGQVGIGTRSGKFDRHFAFRSGSFSISQHGNWMTQGVFWRAYPAPDPDLGIGDLSSLSARLRFTSPAPGNWSLEVPILLLITALVPPVYGWFSSFRFRLWQLFAFTALAALELAFFLRP